MEYRDNLNLIDESELEYTNAAMVDSFTGFDNSPPYQPPYPSPVEGECFTPQPGKTPQQDDGYPPQPGNDPQRQGDYPPQPRNNPHQADYNSKSPVYPQRYGGYPQQYGGYPPHSGGYSQHGGYTQQPDGYPPQPGGYPPQPGGYPPQPGGDGQPGYDQQGYPQEQYDQQQQTVIVTQPMELSVVKGQSRTGNYLIPAIFACLCCCWPFGICAIHYATKANVLAAEGNLTEARIAAKNAFCMTITSVIMGLIFYGASMLYRHFSQQ